MSAEKLIDRLNILSAKIQTGEMTAWGWDTALLDDVASALSASQEEITRLRKALDWQPIENAPKDEFILLFCEEDETTWLAKWQGGGWYGVDDQGLTREGHSDPNFVLGWLIRFWRPLPTHPHEGDSA
jgi:hypothetical protein